jgi:FkbM family methyltransferase
MINPSIRKGILSSLHSLGYHKCLLHINGLRLVLPLEACSLKEIVWFRKKSYEEAFEKTFQALVPSGSTVFDIGANTGRLTVSLANRVGHSGRVVAFEANPETADVLRDVVRLNNWENVRVENVAVGATEGTLSFLIVEGCSPAQRVFVEEQGTPEQVRQVSIDDYVRATGLVPDVVKVDVEGYEFNVVKGALQTLDEHSPALCIEIHPRRMKPLGHTQDQIGQTLRGLGYAQTFEFRNATSKADPGSPFHRIFESCKSPSRTRSASSLHLRPSTIQPHDAQQAQRRQAGAAWLR